MEYKNIKFTNWDGTIPMTLTVPVECDLELKAAIIVFLSELDDHDGMEQCRKLWTMNEAQWNELCGCL